MSVAEQFAQNLVRERRRADLSQEEVALRASLHRTEVSQLERGLRLPRLDTFVKLLSSLGIEPQTLLEGIEWLPGEVRGGCFEGIEAAASQRETV